MTVTATDELISEIEAGLEGVTPGPWDVAINDVPRKEVEYAVVTTGGWFDIAPGINNEADAHHIARCSPNNIAALIARIREQDKEIERLTRERNAHKGKSISRGRRLYRLNQHIQQVCDVVEDDGDRVYFGSTNDADVLKELAQAMDGLNWGAIIRERDEVDPYAEIKRLIHERDEARNKALEDAAAVLKTLLRDPLNPPDIAEIDDAIRAMKSTEGEDKP